MIDKIVIKLLAVHKKKIILIGLLLCVSTGLSFILPILERNLVDEGFLKKDYETLIAIGAVIIFLKLLENGIGFWRTYISTKINIKMNYKLTSVIINKLLKLKMDTYQKMNISEIFNLQKITVSKITEIVNERFLLSAFGIFKIIGGLIGLVMINYQLTILVLIVVPLKSYTVYRLGSKKDKYVKNSIKFSRSFSSWFGDRLGKLKSIKSLNKSRVAKKEFKNKYKSILTNRLKVKMIQMTNNALEDLFVTVINSIVYLAGGILVIRGELSFGGYFAFSLYVHKVMSPFSLILNLRFTLSDIQAGTAEYKKFMNLEEEKDNGRKELYIDSTMKTIFEFNNVSYSYDPDTPLLYNLDFKINRSEKVAIVGKNGSGKSTILDIMLRFIDEYEGDIKFAEHNLENIKLKQLRSEIHYTNQNELLFEDTIYNNLMISPKNEDKLIMYLEKYKLFDFVNNLPKKIETVINHSNVGLSGGEIQLVLLLRALLSDAEVLIFDEVTSNIDSHNLDEFKIILKEIDKTVLVVTHSKEILEVADKVIFIQNGEGSIVGEHSELYKMRKSYSSFIDRSKYDIEVT